MAKDYLVHIVAVDENNGIGYKDQLLFRIKEDLRNFRLLTMGCDVIAGTTTFKTLPELKGRNVFRLTRDTTTVNDPNTVNNIKGFIGYKKTEKKPIFVIGGGEVYKNTLDDVSVIVLTRIHAKAEKCDAWYPDFLSIRKPSYCSESSRHVDEVSGIEYSFHVYGYDKEDLKHFLKHKAKVTHYEKNRKA